MLGAVFLIAALLMSGCAPAGPAPGEKVAKIGLHGLLTGALATTGVPLTQAWRDYIRYADEQGLIEGVRLESTWRDTGGNVPRAVTAYKAHKEQGVVLQLTGKEDDLEAIIGFAQRDEIPFVFIGGYTERVFTRPVPWAFTSTPGKYDEVRSSLLWFRETWKEQRPPRVGGIFMDYGGSYTMIEALRWLGRGGTGSSLAPRWCR